VTGVEETKCISLRCCKVVKSFDNQNTPPVKIAVSARCALFSG